MANRLAPFISPDLIPVIKLRMRFGWTGYGLYCAILTLLERQPDCALTADYEAIAFHLSAAAETIRSIIEDFGLFRFETVDNVRRFFIPALRPKPRPRPTSTVVVLPDNSPETKLEEAVTPVAQEPPRKAPEPEPQSAPPAKKIPDSDIPKIPPEDIVWLKQEAMRRDCPLESMKKLYQVFLHRQGHQISPSEREVRFKKWFASGYNPYDRTFHIE